MIWHIITDSSCDIREIDFSDSENEVRYSDVPFVISVGEHDYIDDENIDIPALLDDMESSKEACQTSCPSSGAWLSEFEKEGNIIAVTISKELSGSYSSAVMARDMMLEKEPNKNIAIINSISAGPGLSIIVEHILAKIRENKSFEEVVAEANRISEKKHTIFALSSFKNLIKNGRVSPFVGAIAQKLNFWGIGIGSKIGTIEIKGKVRGSKKALAFIIKDIQEKNLDVQSVIISHCENLEFAQKLRDELKKLYKNVTIEIHETKGLCSFYAERHGLVVSYV